MRHRSTGRAIAAWTSALLALSVVTPGWAQLGAGASVPPAEKLVHISAAPLTLDAGSRAEAAVTLQVENGWHINANPPSPDYMIATEVDFSDKQRLSVGAPRYPAPRPLKVGFEESVLLVYGGTVVVNVPITAGIASQPGPHTLKGRVRFQACNDQVCLAPVIVPFDLVVTVKPVASAPRNPVPEGGASGPAVEPAGGREGSGAAHPSGPDSAPPQGSGFSTAPPPPGAAAAVAPDNPIARALERGSWSAFLTLFLIGLALNLTPCVYPMLSVTVSIFGARRSAPPLQVFGMACVYVLGMAVMYSTLGLVAALTGGLFGGVLQSPMVQIGIGLLLAVLSLSMFGLYEFQIPPQLLSRLGGTTATSVAGTFGSGLLVGVFAAPCVGPPVVALLAVVGAKGDPWFGFLSFFVLALGLGAPYLVLGTFSNLLQTLPRSGEWMVWVKKVFGVLLLALGAFYVSLAVRPGWTPWIAPVALIVGGLYLGFVEKSGGRKRGFTWLKRVGGAAALAAGVAFVVTAPAESIAFEPLTPAALDAALKGGTPAMLDFTANWCAPCHELERNTFTDPRVRAAARSFRTFRVDLTRYDSPEAERWRRDYGIHGVPTVVFMTPDGSEVKTARVEGFLPPDRFLERMRQAAAQRAAGG